MCGIAGIFNFDGEPVERGLLKRMTDAVAHRGPDGEGHYVEGPIGLGHRRLAIIDLSDAARQPMPNETGDVLLVYNGEIYNFQPICAPSSRARAIAFTRATDSEVIVHGYEKWGDDCVDRLNGMFAFALWDGRAPAAVLARDRYGIKPLYYWQDASTVIFASEIKALLLHPRVTGRTSTATRCSNTSRSRTCSPIGRSSPGSACSAPARS